MPGPQPTAYRSQPRGGESIQLHFATTYRASFSLIHRSSIRHMRNALREYASFVRRKSKDIIRTRKRISRPGEPPSSHAGFLRSGLRFAQYRPDVYVVGFVKMHGRKGSNIPRALEFGGRVWQKRIARGNRYGGKVVVSIKPRPTLQPARDIERRKLPTLLKKNGAKIHGARRR